MGDLGLNEPGPKAIAGICGSLAIIISLYQVSVRLHWLHSKGRASICLCYSYRVAVCRLFAICVTIQDQFSRYVQPPMHHMHFGGE